MQTEEDYNYNEDDKVTRADAIKAVGEIIGDYKKAYKSASKKDKATVLKIIIPLALTFVLGFIGIFLANIGQYLALRKLEILGFVFMGVGLGGFFLIIIGLLIWAKLKEKR